MFQHQLVILKSFFGLIFWPQKFLDISFPHQLFGLPFHQLLIIFGCDLSCSVYQILFFGLKFTNLRLDSRFSRGQKSAVNSAALSVRSAKSLSGRDSSTGNLLGTLETIFKGRRHRNDFNILRSMGNSSPTITVSHLEGRK